MNYEELLKIAEEQDQRIFRFEASLSFAALPSFTKDHFSALNRSYIINASWEMIKATNFPFEQIITANEFVCTTGNNIDGIVTFTGITTKFSVTILNQPSATLDDFIILIRDYFNGFGEYLIQKFKLPMELKGSTYLLDLPKSHKIYKDLINNAL